MSWPISIQGRWGITPNWYLLSTPYERYSCLQNSPQSSKLFIATLLPSRNTRIAIDRTLPERCLCQQLWPLLLTVLQLSRCGASKNTLETPLHRRVRHIWLSGLAILCTVTTRSAQKNMTNPSLTKSAAVSQQRP